MGDFEDQGHKFDRSCLRENVTRDGLVNLGFTSHVGQWESESQKVPAQYCLPPDQGHSAAFCRNPQTLNFFLARWKVSTKYGVQTLIIWLLSAPSGTQLPSLGRGDAVGILLMEYVSYMQCENMAQVGSEKGGNAFSRTRRAMGSVFLLTGKGTLRHSSDFSVWGGHSTSQGRIISGAGMPFLW